MSREELHLEIATTMKAIDKCKDLIASAMARNLRPSTLYVYQCRLKVTLKRLSDLCHLIEA